MCAEREVYQTASELLRNIEMFFIDSELNLVCYWK